MLGILEKLSRREPKVLDKSVFVSAVLVPLIEKDGETEVLFEVRSKALKRQPGEICFPGGRVESHEFVNPMETALREASEELGISKDSIEIAGPLDRLMTPVGALAHPFVGQIMQPDMITPNADEVDEVFTIPLHFFLHNPPRLSYVETAARYSPDFPFDKVPPHYKPGWQPRTKYPMYLFEYKDRFIWGMTARIIYNFITVCWPENEKYRNLKD